jgi:hypothetical protein
LIDLSTRRGGCRTSRCASVTAPRRAAVDENPPAVAVDGIRAVLDKEDDDDLRRRIDELHVPDPARELPPRRTPDPLRSTTR